MIPLTSVLKPLVRIASEPEKRSLVLLMLALSTVFVFGGERGSFHRPGGQHNHISQEYLAVAANMSSEHGFLGFIYRFLNETGEPAYHLYNRFPISGYLLIKAAILPFPDDLSAQIQAARMLVLAFFAAAVVAAYLALRRLTSSPGIALTATLLGFSSFNPLYYSDMVAIEGSIDLFAVMLTFHAMVLFVQEGRFRQLLVKTCAALLLGWHVYALILPFILFGLVGEWIRGRPWIALFARSRHLALGLVALTFGLSVLAFNFAREYTAVSRSVSHLAQDHKTTLAELPSFRSMVKGLGWDPDFNERHGNRLAWRPFLNEVFKNAARAIIPLYIENIARTSLDDRSGGAVQTHRGGLYSFVLDLARLGGVVVFAASAAGLMFVRHRSLWATMATFGFCWVLLMRSTITQQFEGMFLVGLPLVFFSLVLLPVRRVSERLIGGSAGAAVLIFVLSSVQIGRIGSASEASDSRVIISDYNVIRRVVAEDAVIVPHPWTIVAPFFFLSGKVFLDPNCGRQRHRAQVVITHERTPNGTGLLTPHNQRVFLYDRDAHDAQYVTLGAPLWEGWGTSRPFRGPAPHPEHQVPVSRKRVRGRRTGHCGDITFLPEHRGGRRDTGANRRSEGEPT